MAVIRYCTSNNGSDFCLRKWLSNTYRMRHNQIARHSFLGLWRNNGVCQQSDACVYTVGTDTFFNNLIYKIA